MLEYIVTNKPEYIDPENENLTYYYNRDKFRKSLEEKKLNYYSQNNSFIRSGKSRVLLLGILVVFAMIAFFSSKDKKDKSFYNGRENNILLSAYYQSETRETVVYLSFSTLLEWKNELEILRMKIVFMGENKKIIFEKKLEEAQKIILEPSKTFTMIWNEPSSRPLKILFYLKLPDKEIILEKKLE
ncbi:MAG TPA: hypothetical protein DHW82_00235 [Spirochaetia bacterium]|nr:hypothetical protein [Spirochaetia bacterium]